MFRTYFTVVLNLKIIMVSELILRLNTLVNDIVSHSSKDKIYNHIDSS